MGNITVNKKMELMRQIRSRYQQDRNDLFRREQILYGRTTARQRDGDEPLEGYEQNGEGTFPSFPLRLLAAAGIFLLIVLCDRSGGEIAGISADRCFQAISADYESSISLWADTAFPSGGDRSADYPPAGSRP